MVYPFSEHHTLELEPAYAELQKQADLHRVRMPHGGDAWLAVRYEAVRQVLADPRFSRARANRTDVPRLSSEVLPSTSLMAMDPPVHTRIRRALALEFSTQRIETWRGRAVELVEELLERMATVGQPADLISHLAAPFPLLMICELLGISAGDREHFEVFAAALRSRQISSEERDDARRAFESFIAERILDAGRLSADGLLSRLRPSQDPAEGTLSTAELVDVVIALLVGGVGSPSTLLASSICLLLQRPDVIKAVRSDPSQVPGLVEELLRLVPVGVGGGFVRVALDDVLVGDTLVRRGEAVVPAMPAANHDPDVFPDPDELRLDRDQGRRHVGLGHGTHHCIGAHLARVEMQTAITSLLNRFPDLRLAVPAAELPWHSGLVVRELKELPVIW